MIYYILSIGINNSFADNELRYEEIDEERYNKIKQQYKDSSEYRFSDTSCNKEYDITWDLNSNYMSGYIKGVATEENFNEIKQQINDKMFNFIKNMIEVKQKDITRLTEEVNQLEKYPLYDAITKTLRREEKINQILN